MVALGQLNVKHGTKVTLFNRRGPKVRPLTARDIQRLRGQLGEKVGREWRAVVKGVAIVATVDE
jgi:hypothetical protein